MYEVYGPDKELKMVTNSAECLPKEHVDDMFAAGYVFKDSGKVMTKSQVKSAQGISGTGVVAPASKPYILCVTTGKEYPNQAAAARDLGIDPAQVSDSIKTGKTRSGYLFKKEYAQ